MQKRKKTPGPLTENEKQVLRALKNNINKLNTPFTCGHFEAGWCRSKDVGGYQDSFHSHVLSRLANKDLIDKKPYTGKIGLKMSWIYKINSKGLMELERTSATQFSYLKSISKEMHPTHCHVA